MHPPRDSLRCGAASPGGFSGSAAGGAPASGSARRAHQRAARARRRAAAHSRRRSAAALGRGGQRRCPAHGGLSKPLPPSATERCVSKSCRPARGGHLRAVRVPRLVVGGVGHELRVEPAAARARRRLACGLAWPAVRAADPSSRPDRTTAPGHRARCHAAPWQKQALPRQAPRHLSMNAYGPKSMVTPRMDKLSVLSTPAGRRAPSQARLTNGHSVSFNGVVPRMAPKATVHEAQSLPQREKPPRAGRHLVCRGARFSWHRSRCRVGTEAGRVRPGMRAARQKENRAFQRKHSVSTAPERSNTQESRSWARRRKPT